MTLIKKLNEAIEELNKMEGVGSVYWMYGWGKKQQKVKEENSQKYEEDDDKEYRDKTQGDRNSKYLMKARIYADTPQARLKKQRTEFQKELNGR